MHNMYVFICICNVLQIRKSVTLVFLSMYVGVNMPCMMCMTSLKKIKKNAMGKYFFWLYLQKVFLAH